MYGLQVDVIYFASSSVKPSLCTLVILLEPCRAQPLEGAATRLRHVLLLACMDSTGCL